MAELSELTCCASGLASKSELLRRPKAHHSFILKLSHHGGKTIKTFSYRYMVSSIRFHVSSVPARSWFFSDAIAERCFSSDDVFSCAATSGEVRACVGACSQTHSHDISTKARRAKDIS